MEQYNSAFAEFTWDASCAASQNFQTRVDLENDAATRTACRIQRCIAVSTLINRFTQRELTYEHRNTAHAASSVTRAFRWSTGR